MNRNRPVYLLSALLLASATIFAANAADQNKATAGNGASASMSAGTYSVNFHVNVPSTVPDGADILCKASITAHQATLFGGSRQSASVEFYPGFAKVSGSSANCTVRLPLASTAGRWRDNAELGYEIDAFTTEGQAFSRTQQNIDIGLPDGPTAESLRLNVNF
jgi:hypothetical protein